jgi:NAD(P)-dependent dehydrogenase (short-subunit alcohol dehydrogenase family)
MATKTLSLELKNKGILTIIMHPGWVQTDMGGPNGLLTTEQSVSGITSVLEKLNADDNGKFLQYDGKEMPW